MAGNGTETDWLDDPQTKFLIFLILGLVATALVLRWARKIWRHSQERWSCGTFVAGDEPYCIKTTEAENPDGYKSEKDCNAACHGAVYRCDRSDPFGTPLCREVPPSAVGNSEEEYSYDTCRDLCVLPPKTWYRCDHSSGSPKCIAGSEGDPNYRYQNEEDCREICLEEISDCVEQSGGETVMCGCSKYGATAQTTYASTCDQCECQCLDGFAGDQCEKCAEGRGPQYPCCHMHLYWPNDIEAVKAPCWTNAVDKNGDQRFNVRDCNNSHGGCWPSPTWTGKTHNAGGGEERYACEYWVDASNGLPFQYSSWQEIDYNGGMWSENEYHAAFEAFKEEGLIVPAKIWCDLPDLGILANDPENAELYSRHCVHNGNLECKVAGDIGVVHSNYPSETWAP